MTTTPTLTLTAFLEARIAEDEAVAEQTRGTAFGQWRFVPDPDGRLGGYVAPGGAYPSPATAIANDWSGRQIGAGYVAVADHIARHDPARVLAECKAHRQIVELATTGLGIVMRPVLTTLAAVWASHPDYNPDWA